MHFSKFNLQLIAHIIPSHKTCRIISVTLYYTNLSTVFPLYYFHIIYRFQVSLPLLPIHLRPTGRLYGSPRAIPKHLPCTFYRVFHILTWQHQYVPKDNSNSRIFYSLPIQDDSIKSPIQSTGSDIRNEYVNSNLIFPHMES